MISQSSSTLSTSPLEDSSCAHRFLLLSAPTGHRASQLSSGCTSIGLSRAVVKSRTGSSTSYSVLISFIALSTQFSVSPATMATGSPINLTCWSSISLSYGLGSG